jgi:alkylhydroperoxidase family enzyme
VEHGVEEAPAGAPVSGAVRAALRLIRVLTLEPDAFGHDDVVAARRAGLADDAILDALLICAAFNIIDRVADAMAFAVPPDEHLRAGARMIRRFGYGLPALVGAVTRDR